VSLGDDLELAVRAVRRGGAAALARFGTPLDVADKGSGADPVTLADREAEAAIVELLRAERPQDGVLGEEGAAADASGPSARRWVVDGLDGTANFVAGIPHWCVALGLEQAGEAVAAAVLDPVRGELFAGARGEGLVAPDAGRGARGRIVATFLHPRLLPAADAGALATRLLEAGMSVRIGGSGTLDLAWVAAGRLDAWVERDTAPWDWIPGQALVEAAGGHCLVRDGWHVATRTHELAAELAEVVTRS
jgi:fructose-1,6-bisphosphatase/inositol monophosphatase family enzyme